MPKESKGCVRVKKLKLNPDKMEAVLVGSRSVLGSSCTQSPEGLALTPKNSVCSLVLPDLGLLLDLQVMAVVKSAYYQFWLVCKLHLLHDKKNLSMVSLALIGSRLDYCNAVPGVDSDDNSKIITGTGCHNSDAVV